MNSWDRFEVPLPFSRAIFLYGEPFLVPRDLDDTGREQWRKELERRLNGLAAEAEHRFDELYRLGSRA